MSKQKPPATPPPAKPKPTPTPRYEPLRLKIQPVITVAEELAARVKSELPGHDGLATAAAGVVAAAQRAQGVSRSMKRVFSLHKLPAYFLATAILALCGWTYWQFVHVSTLRLALPDRDASLLRERVAGGRVRVRVVTTPGSRECVEMVTSRQVDLAFVQGGIAIPRDLPVMETSTPEVVLWLVRDRVNSPHDVRRVLTSVAGEGSHSVAQVFIEAWHIRDQVTFTHDWRELTTDSNYTIADEIDGVFVVKDPLDEKTAAGLARVLAAGFRLESPDIGARAAAYDYLNPTTLSRGYLQPEPPAPAAPIATYSVPTFLVARSNLTPRLFNEAAHVLELRRPSIKDKEFTPTTSEASELFQGIEAFMGILINIVLVFLALLGLDMWTYRKQLHELNSVISLLSVLQSNKDVLGLKNDKQKTENLLYLSLVSDLLGVISMISSYYTQENSSLLFNNLSEVIHQRCDGLKINIQLKILHATVTVP